MKKQIIRLRYLASAFEVNIYRIISLLEKKEEFKNEKIDYDFELNFDSKLLDLHTLLNCKLPWSQVVRRLQKSIETKDVISPQKRPHLSKKIITLHNRFKKIKTAILFGGEKISSHFTDADAISICKKIDNPTARRLVKDLDNTLLDRNEILYKLHYIAEKALSRYGGRFLSFIYSLKPLDNFESTVLALIDYKSFTPSFPILTFEEDPHYKLFFYVRKDVQRKYIKRAVKIGLANDYKDLSITLYSIKPIITLYLDKVNGIDVMYSLSAGINEGVCLICERKLTNPKSILNRIGPCCAKKNFH